MNNTTLKKISEALGISISTVSRALKDHPDIAEKTKDRVRELAETLDYEPNTNAIQLRTKKSNLFGLIVPTVSNLFYDSFIAAVEEESRKTNHSLMILQSGDDPAIELENLKLCRQNRINGLFICISSKTTNIEAFMKLKAHDVPVIFFDKVPDTSACNKVCVADNASAELAAEIIRGKNKQKVLALFGNDQMSITKKRKDIFLQAFGKTVEVIIHHVNNSSEAERITTEDLKQNPDTVFCMSDEILTGAMKALQKAELKIPGDISVIAISNGYIPKLYYPEITYVETSGYKLGKLAFSRMKDCLDGDKSYIELNTDAILQNGGSI